MKQTLHIFAKDVRRFWPEILISLTITAAFAWLYPNQWLPMRLSASPPRMTNQLISLLPLLVPVSWWLLISRLIHAERLVGNTQFWLTRPYEWKKLLAAKLLFLVLFLYLPIFIAQCLLLVAAGFHPLSYLPGLLYNLLIITGIIVLPLVALATVTSSFARMTLTVLGILCGIAGILILSSYVNMEPFTVPYEPSYSLALVLSLCGAAVLVQYAFRKVWLARLLLIAPPVLFICISEFIPGSSLSLIDRTYPCPASTAGAPIQLSYGPDALHQPKAYQARRANEVGIDIPLKLSGMGEGFAVVPDGVQISIESPSGPRWISPWEPVYMTDYLPEDKDSNVNFTMPRAIYDELKSTPFSVRLTIALTQVQAVNSTRISFPAHEFSVPDFGICAPLQWMPPLAGIICHSPVRQPPLASVSVLWSNTPCSASQTEPGTVVQGVGWIGKLDPDAVPFGIVPVWEFGFILTNEFQDEHREHPRYLCPGSPVIFTRYKLVRRAQTSLAIQDFHLPALQ
jgi:hypothetical protein